MIHIETADCLVEMRQMHDNEFDLAIVDPPYFDGPQKLGFYGGRCSKTGVRRNGYKKLGQWNVPTCEYFHELFRVSEHQIIWGVNYFTDQAFSPGRIIWDKCNEATTYSDCEIAFCSKIKHVKKFTYMWSGMMQGKSITQGHLQRGNKKTNEKRIHPTQKPVDLYKWLLTTFSATGQKVLDTHVGSGSIAIACHDLGINLTGFEIDPEYRDAAVRRLKNHQAQMQLVLAH